MNLPTIKMKLNESNDLRFAISMNGGSLNEDEKPVVRFVVIENDTGVSFGFPMNLEENGTCSVCIPKLPQVFKEDMEYTGNVEIVVGSEWFNPASIKLVFESQTPPIITEELEKIDGVINSEPMLEETKEFQPEFQNLARQVLFAEKPKPKPKQVVPTKTLSPELQKAKQALKTLLFEAWSDME